MQPTRQADFKSPLLTRILKAMTRSLVAQLANTRLGGLSRQPHQTPDTAPATRHRYLARYYQDTIGHVHHCRSEQEIC